MKKLFISLFAFVVFISISAPAFSRPIYIGLRIGIFAKWSVVLGDCEPGMGLCISVPLPSLENGQFGFDAERKESLLIRVAKSNEISKPFSSGKFVLEEDSPVDSRLITQFKSFENPNQKLVILKKGTYTVKAEGDYYVIAFNYYLK